MASLLPAFNRSAAMKTRHSSCDEQAVLQRLRDMPVEDMWSDAGVPELLSYAFGAKGLSIPRSWWSCFPSSHFQL